MKQAAAALLLLGVVSCRVEFGAPSSTASSVVGDEAPSGELWVYTSLYQHVVTDLEAVVRAKLPGVQLQWFTGGSEKVSQRVDAELAAGATRADVLLISDPFFFERMKREGRLLPYVSPRALRVDRSLVDPDGTWVSTRQAAMVLAYNTQKLPAADAPRSFQALTEPRFAGQLIMGDPLASGTFFTTVAFLSDRLGWGYFEALRANRIVSTGGNSAVIERVSAGELLAGPVLLENVLAARKKGAPIDFVVPSEGAVVIPGPEAIFKSTRNPRAAQAFVDVLFSPEGQAALVRGDMYAADPAVAGPDGAPPWAELSAGAMPWSPALLARVERDAQTIRAEFRRIVQK